MNKAGKELSQVAGGAQREYFFPLLSHNDLKPVFLETILPKALPWTKTYAWFLAGMPNVGKTTFAKTEALLQGRYQIIDNKFEQAFACWRRGKKLERFNKLRQEIFEMLMLDDPKTAAVEEEDVKAFGDVGEAGSGDGRYADSTYHQFASRALLTNNVDLSHEPEPEDRDGLAGTIAPTARSSSVRWRC